MLLNKLFCTVKNCFSQEEKKNYSSTCILSVSEMGEQEKPLWIKAVVGIVKVFLYGYEALTWIVWKLTINPRQRRAISNRIKVRVGALHIFFFM